MSLRSSIAAVLACLVVLGASPMTALADPLDPNAFTSLGTLNVTTPVSVRFNTWSMVVEVDGQVAFTGGVVRTESEGLGVAVFTFNNVNIGSAASIYVDGNRPVAILSKGNISISSLLSVSARDGYTGSGGYLGGYVTAAL